MRTLNSGLTIGIQCWMGILSAKFTHLLCKISFILLAGMSFIDFSVFIPEGPKTDGQFIDSIQILLLVFQKASPEITKLMEESEETFGRKYIYCRTLAYFLKHKQKQEATNLLKDFDFKTSGVEAILKKLCEVALLTNMPFVVTIPFEIWTSNREKITSVTNKDLIFKTKHI